MWNRPSASRVYLEEVSTFIALLLKKVGIKILVASIEKFGARATNGPSGVFLGDQNPCYTERNVPIHHLNGNDWEEVVVLPGTNRFPISYVVVLVAMTFSRCDRSASGVAFHGREKQSIANRFDVDTMGMFRVVMVSSSCEINCGSRSKVDV